MCVVFWQKAAGGSFQSVESFGAWNCDSELEALATLLSLHLFESHLVDKDAVVFTDNNAVLSAFISGRSSTDVVRPVVNRAFMWEDRLGLLLWHELNIADGPSRGVFASDLGERILETCVERDSRTSLTCA